MSHDLYTVIHKWANVNVRLKLRVNTAELGGVLIVIFAEFLKIVYFILF